MLYDLTGSFVSFRMTGTTGGARFVRCYGTRVAPAGCVGKKVPQSTVILGLDPRIHEETGTVPVVRWIAGSKSGNDNKKEPGDNLHGRCAADCPLTAPETALLWREVEQSFCFEQRK